MSDGVIGEEMCVNGTRWHLCLTTDTEHKQTRVISPEKISEGNTLLGLCSWH